MNILDSVIVPEPLSGCWLWTGSVRGNGYGTVWVDGRNHYAHRASYEYHVGPIPTGAQINHKCDTRMCINPDHLYAGSQQDNVDDMCRRGRHNPGRHSGETHPRAKLTLSDVLSIRQRRAVGETYREIHKLFPQVCQGTLRMIGCGKNWEDLS